MATRPWEIVAGPVSQTPWIAEPPSVEETEIELRMLDEELERTRVQLRSLQAQAIEMEYDRKHLQLLLEAQKIRRLNEQLEGVQ